MRNIYDLALESSLVRPEDLALISPTSRFSNLELLQAVDAVADRFFEVGLRPGQLALTQLDPDLDWIATVALAKLGLTSGSVIEFSELALNVDYWLITSSNRQSTKADKTIHLDRSWLEPAEESGSVTQPHAFEDGESFRVIMTSGTSGTPKIALYNFGAIVTKFDSLKVHWQAPARDFNFMGLASIGGFASALACLSSVRPYITSSKRDVDLVDFLIESGVDALSGSPYQISHLLKVLAKTHKSLPAIKSIRLAGSTPSPDLVDQILEDFDVQLVSVYGSTECGGIFITELSEPHELNSLGSILPFASATVVDQDGNELADGEEGLLATKSAAMFSGYLGRNGELNHGLTGGWFLTGDRAVRSRGSFVILGRESEILNIGGVKVDAAPIDAYALQYQGVTEAVSFETTGQLGQPMLAMAYVGTEEVQSDEFSKYMVDKFPNGAPQVIGQVNMIPRTAMGKPRRAELAKLFRDLLIS